MFGVESTFLGHCPKKNYRPQVEHIRRVILFDYAASNVGWIHYPLVQARHLYVYIRFQ